VLLTGEPSTAATATGTGNAQGSIDVGALMQFASLAEAIERVPVWEADARKGIVLTGDIETMAALCAGAPSVRTVNVGGIHFRAGRTERLRYVYLTDEEAARLRRLAASGVEVTAQDVPTVSPVPLDAFA
jgi:PTS system mannose-specific IIB component/fructoselysine and glucoselysine-specific PTS system IIB component